MNASRPPGFTLVEVLVAIALAGLITAVAVSLLYTTRQVAVEIQQPLETDADGFLKLLQDDLDHLLPQKRDQTSPPITIDPTAGLSFNALRRDDVEIPHPMRITYVQEGVDLLRIASGGIPMNSTTNQVLQAVSTFEPSAVLEDQTRSVWPDDDLEGHPERIEIQIGRIGEPALEAVFDLPTTIIQEAEDEGSENN